MTTVSNQVQYESTVRFRWAVVAFSAALLLVVSQLIQLSGAQPPVSEATVTLITENQRATVDIIGAVLDFAGLIAVAALLNWLHHIAQARQPTLKAATRWVAVGGATLAAVMAVVYTVLFTAKAHQFVTTGNQSYPQAKHLIGGTGLLVLQLPYDLGLLLLAIGLIFTSLSVMRVGLITRLVGYVGVVAGALFLFQIPVLTTIVQAYWLAAIAVTLARRWPSGDPPAWESGVAVPWMSTRAGPPQDNRGTRAQRRRRVSDQEVLEAVQQSEAPPNPKAGRSKRKRRH